ncbi:putative proteinDH-UBIQUINONE OXIDOREDUCTASE B8 SUBUNIT [Salix viminalis]|uniref:Ribosomal protein/NADH dehydrogenase domain-containing protein n=1 Tax=Salix viminalis TaxID=40686 RepID=A0A9Q0T6L9_SALVM|nr:putative proteinDH-UBIQUINONE OXIDOREDUCTASE B8 SUBUNIT [Salix viminalis]
MAWRGQLSKNLKELRILLCQSSPSSSTTRTFIEKNYKDLKTLNPKLPILIRECNGIEPQLWARYDFGVERGVRLEGLSEPQISKALEELGKVDTYLGAGHPPYSLSLSLITIITWQDNHLEFIFKSFGT